MIMNIFQAFFIDHVMRTTTFMDPRLPTDVPLIDPDFRPPAGPRARTAPRSSHSSHDAPVPPPRHPVAESPSIPTGQELLFRDKVDT